MVRRRSSVLVAAFAAFLATLSFAPRMVQAAATQDSPQASDQQVTGIARQIAANLVNESDAYFEKGDYARAIADMRVEVGARPDDMSSYADAGWLMESGKDYPDAEAIYQLGVANNPGKSFAAYQLGFFYFQTRHEYGKAVAVMAKTVHDPDSEVVDWKLLAHSYRKNGQLAKSLATWMETKRRFPTDAAVDVNIREVKAMIQKHSGGSQQSKSTGK